MGEGASQGITRRDLLRRGAVLGGAVVWTTPVVQTLGMGRAFAQETSPVGGKDISYIGINVICNGDVNDPNSFFVKWEEGEDPLWETDPGAAPECIEKEDLPSGRDGATLGFDVQAAHDDSCRRLKIPSSISSATLNIDIDDLEQDCEVTVWVKGGSSNSTNEPCRTYTESELNIGDYTTVCTSPA